MSSELTAADRFDSSRVVPGSRGNHLRRYHLAVLLASIAVLVAAFLLRVRPDQRIELAALPGFPFPEACYSRAVFGWNCPGCGLTRSFVHLASGDVSASLAVNHVGWVFAIVITLQLPYRLWALCSANGLPLGRRIPWLFLWVPFALLVANWLAGLASLLA